jgi:hypothetical protein
VLDIEAIDGAVAQGAVLRKLRATAAQTGIDFAVPVGGGLGDVAGKQAHGPHRCRLVFGKNTQLEIMVGGADFVDTVFGFLASAWLCKVRPNCRLRDGIS